MESSTCASVSDQMDDVQSCPCGLCGVWAKTTYTYIRCIYSKFGRDLMRYTVIYDDVYCSVLYYLCAASTSCNNWLSIHGNHASLCVPAVVCRFSFAAYPHKQMQPSYSQTPSFCLCSHCCVYDQLCSLIHTLDTTC
jgi:hypothetical protein